MQRSILIMILFLSGIINSIAQEKHTITLEFEGIKSNKGSLFVALYNTEDTFLKKPLNGTIVKIVNKKAIVVLKGISAGVYAVSVFHDINDNKKMDTNFLGIPKEPTGMSNNAKGFMGPPKYKDAKFKVLKDIKLNINIK
ncbi:DUF2141 domain-containing protein [Tenacibaculum ovolyticum]|jgi:uncharacterized protein (DUF2141 family)|uniref:DUF2141 domain-containing protein n=1 Tax=Tenacibaculum ovolyticum TaxID=104270 RepID=UPI0007ED947D|nr:DUF2141 domain-containing protein [Tenacibaculum ovolyticum]WBX75497.1 DUF2141 domain-containing protein [Tenacibaculum ovolyticum]